VFLTVQSEVCESLACNIRAPAAGGVTITQYAHLLHVPLCLIVCHLSGHIFLIYLHYILTYYCACVFIEAVCEILN